MDSQRDGLTVGLLAHDSLNVHDIFETIDRSDFASTAFVGATCDENFVVFADGNRSDLVTFKLIKKIPPQKPVSNGARAIGIIDIYIHCVFPSAPCSEARS